MAVALLLPAAAPVVVVARCGVRLVQVVVLHLVAEALLDRLVAALLYLAVSHVQVLLAVLDLFVGALDLVLVVALVVVVASHHSPQRHPRPRPTPS